MKARVIRRREKKKKKDDISKEEKVEGILQMLQEKHGRDFTPMQYRIWAEMHAGGYHPSLDEAPANSMFLRAGGATLKRRSTADIAVTQLTPLMASSHSSALSPARIIDNGSTISSSVSFKILDEEYVAEKRYGSSKINCKYNRK